MPLSHVFSIIPDLLYLFGDITPLHSLSRALTPLHSLPLCRALTPLHYLSRALTSLHSLSLCTKALIPIFGFSVHQSDLDDEDDNVKQLDHCAILYLALQELEILPTK
ncbi:uncharacterized protein LOC110006820 [Amborella trichopoda]|uniref:uncharacterized protein LOC110006820 n=1 Tax=Amborella trichopoda TaxID=13333 RepID=UPI0009BCA907|nr:uncharacterized protein LOC110006820 [Amborella trichopoda]|eukprot:XP_020519857.1 uncharacterized protein LOC110006820 [Amborella trichopoda]